MKSGIVKWFDPKKGYGFISADNKDYFVHYRSIAGTGFKNLLEGQKVSFDVRSTERGFAADNVQAEIS